jgi:hypothetical protein
MERQMARKHLSRATLIASCAALPVVSVVEPSQVAFRGARLYDGTRSVVIQTTRGNCQPAIRAGVSISAGRVMSNDESYAVEGRVAPNGAIRVNVSAGGQGAGDLGRLSHNAGQGLWRTRSGECSGQWTTARE